MRAADKDVELDKYHRQVARSLAPLANTVRSATSSLKARILLRIELAGLLSETQNLHFCAKLHGEAALIRTKAETLNRVARHLVDLNEAAITDSLVKQIPKLASLQQPCHRLKELCVANTVTVSYTATMNRASITPLASVTYRDVRDLTSKLLPKYTIWVKPNRSFATGFGDFPPTSGWVEQPSELVASVRQVVAADGMLANPVSSSKKKADR